jgi:DNA-binding transcriptional MerR regulator
VSTVAAGDDQLGARAEKSASAFRTISEVSETIDVPQHVLRFWETKFPQIRPMKRGGGRRYYRPEDVELLRRIRSLLYNEGYTIKGVQRLLRSGRGAKPAADAAGDKVAPKAVGPDGADSGADDPPDTGVVGRPDRGGADGPESDAVLDFPSHDIPSHVGDTVGDTGGDAVRLAEVEAAVRQEFSEIRAEVVELREMLRRRLG